MYSLLLMLKDKKILTSLFVRFTFVKQKQVYNGKHY